MKKTWKAALLASLAIGALVVGGCGNDNKPAADSKELPKIGFAIYKFDDTFMSGVRQAITDVSKGKATIEMADSQNSQPTQNNIVDLFISKKYAAMGINPVDRTACSVMVDKAKAANIPVVFFNREPFKADLEKWDKAFYVGAPAKQSGEIQGQILADYFKKHPEAYRSNDNVMHLVIIEGEPGHQDAVLRTEWVQKALAAHGVKVDLLAKQNADWDRVKGQEKMAAFIARFGDKIDAVAANNDDMALGAIEALKAAGYFKDGKYMPVVGVDATAPGIEAVKNGTLLGTVLNDAKGQALATFNTALALAKGQAVTKENDGGFAVEDKHYIWVPYQAVTKENVDKMGK